MPQYKKEQRFKAMNGEEEERPRVSFLPYFGILIFVLEVSIIVLCCVKLQSDDGWPHNAQGRNVPVSRYAVIITVSRVL